MSLSALSQSTSVPKKQSGLFLSGPFSHFNFCLLLAFLFAQIACIAHTEEYAGGLLHGEELCAICSIYYEDNADIPISSNFITVADSCGLCVSPGHKHFAAKTPESYFSRAPPAA